MTYIKKIRIDNNLTRKEMAQILNINLDVYRGIERGDRVTSLKTIKILKGKFPKIDTNIFFK